MSGLGNLSGRVLALHLAVVALLFALQFLLPAYHQGIMARIMVLAWAIQLLKSCSYTG